MDPGIVIDPDLAGLLVPHAPHELALLENSIVADGCRDPLVVWRGRGILLDGHARLAVCRRHALRFTVTEVDGTTTAVTVTEATTWPMAGLGAPAPGLESLKDGDVVVVRGDETAEGAMDAIVVVP